jgi:uncharacterized membrane protein YkvA (DUF1232 family)
MKVLFTILALIYTLSPYDILPDMAVGWGWLDDLAVLYLLWRVFYAARRIGQGADRFNQPYGNDQTGSGSSRTDSRAETDMRRKDPHTILGVKRGASIDEIRLAYRQLANKYHPDKVHHLGEEFSAMAEERFKEIESAYRELVNK